MILDIAIGIVLAVIVLRVVAWIVAVIISNKREEPIERNHSQFNWILLGILVFSIGAVVWHTLQ